MSYLPLVGALAVCASVYAQQGPALQGLTSNTSTQIPVLDLTFVQGAIGADGSPEKGSYTAAPLDPESVSYTEFKDGNYSALVHIDARRMRALRIHFSSFFLPEGAEVFVYRGSESSPFIAGPYREAGPIDGDFWSDAVPGGGIVVIEFQVHGGDLPAVLPFEIDAVEEVEEWRPPAANRVATERLGFVSALDAELIEEVDGGTLIEGDILTKDGFDSPTAVPGSGKERVRSAIGYTSSYYRWPGGVIPYVIDASIAYPSNVATAISHWNTQLPGVITLVPRTNQKDYVRFVNGSGCSSYIGRVGGQQNVLLASNCGIGNIIHEIGHVVGLFHEQSREDRNTWVKINTANMASSSVTNFNQYNSAADDLIYYAYNSVMHYAATAFSSNGKPTIETLPAGIPIGQRTGLDISDIAAVRKMYSKQTTAVSISTVPAGLQVIVDGVSRVTPATFSWPAGSVHTISAPASVTTTVPSQYAFVRWSDGGAPTHTITVPATGLAVAATYALQHKLTTSVTTASTGTLGVAPASGNLYYPQGALVDVAATPAPGYCFSAWTGLAAGTPNQTTLAMTRSLAPAAKFIVGAITPGVTAVSIPKAGGTFAMNTAASTGCGWMVRSSVPWLTVSKAYATSAAPSFNYTVQANMSGVVRVGVLRIDSKTVTITQAP